MDSAQDGISPPCVTMVRCFIRKAGAIEGEDSKKGIHLAGTRFRIRRLPGAPLILGARRIRRLPRLRGQEGCPRVHVLEVDKAAFRTRLGQKAGTLVFGCLLPGVRLDSCAWKVRKVIYHASWAFLGFLDIY